MSKPVLSISITVLTLSVYIYCSLSEAYHMAGCAQRHNQIPIARLESITEDFSAPRNQRVAAIRCLGDYGTEGARILLDLLERDLENFDATHYTLETLGRIRERSVIPALIKFVEKINAYRNGEYTCSFPIENIPRYRFLAVKALIPIAMTAYDVPIPDPPDPNQTHGSVVLCGGDSFGGFDSKGERPKKSDAEKVIALLKKVKKSRRVSMTQTEQRTVEIATKGLNTIERIVFLLRKNGPKLVYRESYGVDQWKATYYIRDASRNIYNEDAFREASRSLDGIDGVLASESVNSLKTVLDDSSDGIRRRAIVLLGYSRHPNAISAIHNTLQSDPSLKVRLQAAVSLGRLAGEQAVPALQEALDNDPRIAPGVISGLGFAGGAGVLVLIKMLEDEMNNPTGGRRAIESILLSLQKSGDRRGIQPIIDYILSPAVSLRSMKKDWINADFQSVRHEAATVLARFVTNNHYSRILHYRGNTVEGLPITPSEHHKVNKGDRNRIIAALKNSGYDIDWLAMSYMKLYDSD